MTKYLEHASELVCNLFRIRTSVKGLIVYLFLYCQSLLNKQLLKYYMCICMFCFSFHVLRVFAM